MSAALRHRGAVGPTNMSAALPRSRVVNCHPYPVSRRVVFDDGNPGACRFYGTGYPSNMFDGTAKRQPMYLKGC